MSRKFHVSFITLARITVLCRRPIYIFDHLPVLRMRNVVDKNFIENENTRFVFNTFSSNMEKFMRMCKKYILQPVRLQVTGACALHVGYRRLLTRSPRTFYVLLSHCKNSCTNVPYCYVIRTLLDFFSDMRRCASSRPSSTAEPLVSAWTV
jgi:hypothetical protein